MNSLITRIISAIVAVIIVGLLYYFKDTEGLRYLCYMAPILGVRELMRILYKPDEFWGIKFTFGILTIAVYWLALLYPENSTLGFAVASILFCCVAIVFEKRFEDLEALSLFQAKGILGFFYIGLLPALATRLLDLENGKIWFLTMLAVVFAGDTFAYITGMLWGKKKILPKISPKKTVVGSLGGLAGSAIAGGLMGHLYLSHFPLWGIISVSIVTGLIAQLGDLFESMLKRVANRKDSGSIMPGHGGILDRLDGVLFGAPIMLAGALLLQKLL